MRLSAILILVIAAAPGFAISEPAIVQPTMLCVQNASAQAHVFAVEAPDAERRVRELAPGERLCVHGVTLNETGVVSVFESFDALEGCSRLVPVGRAEEMIKYVDFDRCFWSSNTTMHTE